MVFEGAKQISAHCASPRWIYQRRGVKRACHQSQCSIEEPESFRGPELNGIRIHYVPHTLEHGSSAALSSLTPADFAEYESINHQGALSRSLMTRAALRRALSDEVDNAITPQQWRFARGDNGRPNLVSSSLDALCPQLDFSCSHAAGMSIVVVSTRGAVGADVVSVDPDMELSLAEMFLAPDEIRSIGDLSKPTPEKRQAFCRYWAVKEACLKLNGGALSERINEIELDPVEDQLKAAPAGDTAYSQVRLRTWHQSALGRNFVAAIAVNLTKLAPGSTGQAI
ncbi:MAG: phosphopantetheinyl transferase [Alphaproteobacteria bacterium]|jgi:phosphopantetheinyl transferase